MRRAMVFGAAGALLVFAACSNDDFGYGYGVPGTVGSASSSASSASSTSGRPDSTGQGFCTDRPFCGDRGCCPPGWRCLRDRCIAPGIACASDADCSGDRYCALALAEPRCFPRETFCDADSGAREDCAPATCAGPDLHITNSTSSCSAVDVYIYNFGGAALPPGAIIAVEQQPKVIDAGAGDAGDAGDAGSVTFESATGVTTDGILPGEVILMRIPFAHEYGMLTTARLDHDAGAGTADCDPDNDLDFVYNDCGQVETP